ncbi:cytochrome P450 [Mycena amicta]|nr:cytochrome P450 [Mycena amicta]
MDGYKYTLLNQATIHHMAMQFAPTPISVLPVALPLLLLVLFLWSRRSRSSSLQYMRGPPNDSWLTGTKDFDVVSKTRGWQSIYGRTFKLYTMFNAPLLFTTDPTALRHILNRDEVYQKPPMVRASLVEIVGRGAPYRIFIREPSDVVFYHSGLLGLEGEEHSRLRKIMTPAFAPSQIRLLIPLFLEKAHELSTHWSRLGSPTNHPDAGWIQVDVLPGLKAMTLDVIGQAGFNYAFNALDISESAQQTQLGKAFERSTQRKLTPIDFLRASFPILKNILILRDATAEDMMDGAKIFGRFTLEAALKRLVENLRVYISRYSQRSVNILRPLASANILSLLVKSNLSEQESSRISDEVIVAQIPTFLVAGHETTGTATAWALYALSTHPSIQNTLRTEFESQTGTDLPTALNALPYLDKVVREVLRLYASSAFTSRVAMKDDVIPLETAYTDGKGSVVVRAVREGQMIFIPIAAVNRDVDIWGPDADEFKPERWDALPDTAKSVPGIYSNLLTFLGGPHNCIGWRFSLAEMKSLLFVLIRAFEFALDVDADAEDIVSPTDTPLQSPMRKGQDGNRLPPRIRRI